MVAQKIYRILIACLYACMLVVFVSGCSGGGSGDQTDNGTLTSVAGVFVDIAAVPGPITAARVGEVVTLEDRKSHSSSNGPLSYSWSFSYKPAGSNAALQGASSATPSFVADVSGVYMLQLVVSAEGVSSQRAVTTVIVNNDNKPTGRFNHQGLSSNCVNCHNDDFNSIPSKGPVHIGASNACQTCHTPQGFNIIPAVDHQEVFGDCSQCHDGVTAIGKSVFHQPTEAECSDCHNTTAFLELNPDGSFDHTNIGRACSGCHNGTVAIGKTPSTVDNPQGTHPDTISECGYCHTTLTFTTPYPDHTGPDVVGHQCSECHGVSAQGEPLGHPVMAVDCEVCHSIVSFSLGIIPNDGIIQFDHSNVDSAVQRCDTCHDGNNSIHAIGKTLSVSQGGTHPDTTKDCSNCHNTETFVGGFQDHTGILNNCQTCHGVTASGKSPNHMPTNPNNTGTVNDEDCSHCHSLGTFTTGSYDHAGVTTGCEACHDNVISVGKLDNHIPTTQNCEVCHQPTDASFAQGTFSHSGITSNCSQCHDGVISTGKKVNHLPTSQDCSFCHVTTTIGGTRPFRDTLNFNHTGINSSCESCHNGNRNYVADGAIGKNSNHIPASNVCADCHNSTATGGFATSTFLSNVHPGIISGCEGCHNSPFLPTANGNPNVIKAASHLPTSQDCDVCHNNNAFKPSIFNHTGITGNCESCHDGGADNVAAGAIGKAQAPSPHPATTADCGSCHAIGNNFTDGSFDHTGIVNNCSACHGDNPTDTPVGPKKNIGHVPTTQDCSVCHVPGTFTTAVFSHVGIVDNCASCHDGNAAVGTVKPVSHLPTTQDCSLCHNTTAFAGARFDHTGIVDNCASCHDGATARGKTPPPNHVPTNDDCSTCHLTTGFIPGIFDHVGIVDNCQSCHNNVFAIGKSGTHVLTNQDCGVCHNTNTFVGAVFDHTGIVDNCESCHNGGTAIGKDAKTNPPHIATALDCHFCHTTATFVGGTWVHGPETNGVCDSCHNGTDARGLPASGHFITTAQCDSCHSTNSWAPASTYRHPNNIGYPGDHNSSVTCRSCHTSNNENITGFPDGTYGTSCAACHDRDYDAGEHRGTLFDNRDCGRSGCHRVSSRSW